MLTHIDKNNQPTMVDVSNKLIRIRSAQAQTLIQLPEEFRSFITGGEIVLKKGPVFQTAIIAGTMAVKKTSELIAFCHHIPIESCKFDISIDNNLLITVKCRVKTSFKTGVEMEALQGASNAALNIYDMCKALSHNIIIKETKLISKTGGKRTLLDKPVFGLVLTGGKSKRMKSDKALLNYHGQPHAEYIFNLLAKYCDEVYLSGKKEQWSDSPLELLPTIVDSQEADGPLSGILSAFDFNKDAYWFVVACDLVYFNEKIIQEILSHHNVEKLATAYRNKDKGFPEPLCTLYSPDIKSIFEKAQANDIRCPVKVLKGLDLKLLNQGASVDLSNINTIEEFEGIMNEKN